jgi:serine/threonine-protein kinase
MAEPTRGLRISTGERMFAGETVAETLAAVLTGEPDLDRVPSQVRSLLRSCLEKEPKRRLRDIGDAWRLIEGPAPGAPAVPAGRSWLLRAAAILAAAAAIAGWALVWRGSTPADLPLTRIGFDLGPDAIPDAGAPAISADGRRLVYPGRGPDGKRYLVTRALDESRSNVITGTENGLDPFLSPDGRWVGFRTALILRKVPLDGGAAVTLARGGANWGGNWGDRGSIVFGGGHRLPIRRIPPAGGDPQPLPTLDAGDFDQGLPQILPGEQAVLFTSTPRSSMLDDASIRVLSLQTGRWKTLLRNAQTGRYLPGGFLLYLHQRSLLATRFDPANVEILGRPVAVVDDVAASGTWAAPTEFNYAPGPAGHGTLIYQAGRRDGAVWQVSWLDSSGKLEPLLKEPGKYTRFRFSPDEKKLAYEMPTDAVPGGADIFVFDLKRETTTRITNTGNWAASVAWAPDSRHLVFSSNGDPSGIYWMRSDGAGEPQMLVEDRQNVIIPFSFAPDGRLAYERVVPGGIDLWTLPLDLTDPDHPKPGQPQAYVQGGTDWFPVFSPNGRWIAYTSSGPVIVRPFPDAQAGKWQVSTAGGTGPVWSKDGKQLFYVGADDRLMVVDCAERGAEFQPGKPRVWSDRPLLNVGFASFTLAPDRKRFVVAAEPEVTGPAGDKTHLVMLINFLDELKRRMPSQ